MPQPPFDLVIRAGRLFCPVSGVDGPGFIAVRNGRIAAIGAESLAEHLTESLGSANQTRSFPDGVVLPGLIDLHAHPAVEGSKYGVDPDTEMLPQGVTTVLSQGDAGAKNWRRYRQTTVERSRTRIRLAINLSVGGESMPGGCFEDLSNADIDACLEAIAQAGEFIWGIAVNVSRIGCGPTDPRQIMRRALEAARQSDKPLLVGLREADDWPLGEQLALLRQGDVVTYCFRREKTCLLTNGKVDPAFRDARSRGVLFDVGHGFSSYSFPVAEAAIRDDFAPDTISTDYYARHVGLHPQHSLPRTMSKLLAAGMPEAEVLSAVTRRAAEILRLGAELGRLEVGALADLTVLTRNGQQERLVDADGEIRRGALWRPAAVYRSREGELLEYADGQYLGKIESLAGG